MTDVTDPDIPARRNADLMYAADAASQWLGMRIDDVGPGSATLTMTVTAQMVNGLDVCHGGIVFTLADSAMAFASNSHGDVSFAVSADMTWLLPATLGDTLTARAREQARRGRTGVYDVDVSNQHGDVIAVFRGRTRATGQSLRNEGGDHLSGA